MSFLFVIVVIIIIIIIQFLFYCLLQSLVLLRSFSMLHQKGGTRKPKFLRVIERKKREAERRLNPPRTFSCLSFASLSPSPLLSFVCIHTYIPLVNSLKEQSANARVYLFISVLIYANTSPMDQFNYLIAKMYTYTPLPRLRTLNSAATPACLHSAVSLHLFEHWLRRVAEGYDPFGL